MVGLHRRGSSAALYVPVHGEPGDITESFSSANRLARTRTGSLTADNTRPAKGELEELEEKESFIPTTRYERPGAAGALGWRDASGRTSRSGRGCGWKGKLVLLVVLGGAIGGAAWFAFFRPESLQEDTWLEAYKPGWWRASLSSVAAEAEATAYGVATGLEANVAWDTATGARDDAYGTATSKWAQASQAAYKGSYNSDGDDYADGDDSDLGDESSELPASSYKDAAVAGVFSAAASELVSTLLDNGTLAAYKWHETLAPLGSAHSKASEGRLLVVGASAFHHRTHMVGCRLTNRTRTGDLHGTHRSLVALLKRLSFSPSSDTLLHVGDLVGKSALNDSLATVSLLRKLGARGVRGNHDQRVLEWRKWMEAYGPLTPSAPSRASASPGAPSSRTSAAVLKVGAALKGMQHRPAGKQVQSGFARVAQAADYARHQAAAASKLQGAHRDASREEERAPMMPRGRKVRRSWMTWLVGDGSDDDEDNEPPLSVFEEPQDDVMVKEDASAAAEDHDVTSFDLLVSAGAPAPSKSSVASKAVSATSKAASGASSASQGGRRPFGRPAALASAATGVPSSSTRTRPSSSSTAARASATVAAPASRLASTFTPVTVYDSTGALLGPSYAHLDPSLTPSQLSSLGLVVPDGWEWGGDHFEIARHLSSADVAYLEQLPLTLWVDELRSYVVHAGMVPWSSLDRVLSRVDGSASAATQKQKQKALAVPATLDSTTPLSFSPSSSLARLLSKDSTRTALVLEKLNTSPSTLLDMRTLAPAGGRKGGDWTVSAKGRKAGKGAVPWWGVWEEGMRECAQRRGCDEVGVLYGHWAGQGLQVQDHSCVSARASSSSLFLGLALIGGCLSRAQNWARLGLRLRPAPLGACGPALLRVIAVLLQWTALSRILCRRIVAHVERQGCHSLGLQRQLLLYRGSKEAQGQAPLVLVLCVLSLPLRIEQRRTRRHAPRLQLQGQAKLARREAARQGLCGGGARLRGRRELRHEHAHGPEPEHEHDGAHARLCARGRAILLGPGPRALVLVLLGGVRRGRSPHRQRRRRRRRSRHQALVAPLEARVPAGPPGGRALEWRGSLGRRGGGGQGGGGGGRGGESDGGAAHGQGQGRGARGAAGRGRFRRG